MRSVKVIHEFEQKFGNRESVKRGCEFLVSYISGLQRPLPEIAAQGFRVAVKYKEGSALRDELEIAEKQVIDFLDARDGTFKFLEYPMEHAVWGILQVYRDLRYHWERRQRYRPNSSRKGVKIGRRSGVKFGSRLTEKPIPR